ncbi:MAG TPA: glycosyltransferase [Candidatus Acidoferrales bacterium]|nr:glycosyltransferase [Candidatus Acidoferrales bacterium]
MRSSSWALFQYTTLAWSRRGLPFGAWIVLRLLRRRGLRCAVVFHEPTRQSGDRWIDRCRGACQDWVIRRLYSGANIAVFLDPLDKIGWLPHNAPKAVFIPIGANIPESEPEDADHHERTERTKTVAVFCLSDPPNRQRELADIAHAMEVVARQGVNARVIFLGRGTEEAREEIERMFDSATVQAVTLGLQSASEIRRILSEADVMLCVRGPLYMRRGSAIAGIACGLPIVAYAGEAEGTPLEDAGVELVPYLDREALGDALGHVLTDDRVLSDLRRRSLTAQKQYFSWDAIADQMAETLGVTPKRTFA